MKIAIVSTPRTCSSFLCELMAGGFGLNNFSEIFSHSDALPESISEARRVEIMRENDDYVAKITSTTFLLSKELDHEEFPWEIFDKIVMTERKSIVHQCASWHFLTCANRNNVWTQRELNEFAQKTLDHPELVQLSHHDNEYMLDDIMHFHRKLKPYLMEIGHPDVRMVNYELFQAPVDEYWTVANELMGTEFPKECFNIISNRTEIDYEAFISHYSYDEVITQMIDLLHPIVTN